MQPRRLVAQLEELDYQADFQIDLVTSLLHHTQAMNSLTQDYIGFAKADVFAVQELYETLVKNYNAALEFAQSRKLRVDEQYDIAVDTHSSSEASLDDAFELESFWVDQRAKAENWLRRAQAYLERCERETARARAELSRAEQELSRAEHALAIARARPPVKVYIGKDSQGREQYRYDPPDTSREEAMVASARSYVSTCRGQLSTAVAEENAARSERDRAQSQLGGAKRAVSDAKEAITMARQALDVAADGKRQANYSQEYAQQCLTVLEQVKLLLEEFHKTCQQQSETLSKLDSEANQAFLHLRDIEGHQESVQGEAFSLKYTLQDKTSLLIAFDQPISSR